MSAMLTIKLMSDLPDLLAWGEEHPADVDPQQRDRVRTYLRELVDVGEEVPLCLPVPDSLADPLEALIDDWAEVSAAHHEDFDTRIVRSDPKWDMP